MRRIAATALLTLGALACADGAPPADAAPANAAAMASASGSAVAANQELPSVMVYKTPTCGCCSLWVDHMREAGFEVETRDLRDLMSIKQDAGVPPRATSCHTALVGEYVVEGHVPADEVKRMLAEQPQIAGIAVPGMPIGSPGMEGPNARPYQVYSFTHAGQLEVFAEIDPR